MNNPSHNLDPRIDDLSHTSDVMVPATPPPENLKKLLSNPFVDCFEEMITVYCIALHNLAVESEHLLSWQEALQNYEMSCSIAEYYFGANADFASKMRNVFQKAREKINQNIEKQ